MTDQPTKAPLEVERHTHEIHLVERDPNQKFPWLRVCFFGPDRESNAKLFIDAQHMPELVEAAKAHVKAEEDALAEMKALGMRESPPDIPYMKRLAAFRAILAKIKGAE